MVNSSQGQKRDSNKEKQGEKKFKKKMQNLITFDYTKEIFQRRCL